MHIAEGVLSPMILGAGAVLAGCGTALGLRRLSEEQLVTTALLASAFFVASLIHVPIGPASAHLILTGIVGLLLGWGAFPAILMGLALQAMLFGYGGLTVLGVNTWNMAFPAAILGLGLRPWITRGGRMQTLAAFACGAGSVLGAGLLTAASLAWTEEGFWQAAQLLLLAHVPVALAEGAITAFVVAFLAKVRPETLPCAPRR